MRLSTICLVLLFGCSSAPLTDSQKKALSNFTYSMKLSELKELVLAHIFERSDDEPDFKNALNDEPYIYQGKEIKPNPLQTVDVIGFKIPIEDRRNRPGSFRPPHDILSDTKDEFAILGGKYLYKAHTIAENKIGLEIYQAKNIIRKEKKSLKSGFDLFKFLKTKKNIVDLDQTFKNATRSAQLEWDLLNQIDPDSANQL